MYAGFPAVTKMDVYGRGKQRGMRIGDVHYDELPKELLLTVVERGRQGPRRRHHHQGGADLVQGQLRRRQDLRQSAVEEAYTVSSGKKDALSHEGSHSPSSAWTR